MSTIWSQDRKIWYADKKYSNEIKAYYVTHLIGCLTLCCLREAKLYSVFSSFSSVVLFCLVSLHHWAHFNNFHLGRSFILVCAFKGLSSKMSLFQEQGKALISCFQENILPFELISAVISFQLLNIPFV